MASEKNRASKPSQVTKTPKNDTALSSPLDSSGRAVFLLIAFAVVAVIFFARLVYLQVIVADEYKEQARETRTTVIDTPPKRGTIYDRNGIVLATSIEATTIYADPTKITDPEGTATLLAFYLGGEAQEYREKISEKGTTFVYVARKAEEEAAGKVQSLKLPGIYFLPDTKRVYPNGQVGGQIVGFADIDGNGIAGLEMYYDEILSGTAGKLYIEQGVGGIPIPGASYEGEKSVNGQDIIISLDIRLQEYVEERLVKGVESMKGESGTAMVMDAGNGEILAAASLPLFNPADTSTVEEGSTEFKGATQAFEPGSTFKAVTMLAVLESGVLTPNDSIFCPSYLSADNYSIKDARDRADATYTVTEILARSSNVGTLLAAERLGFFQLYQYILDYNLTEATGIDYPGESSGYLLEQSQWSQIQAYNVSFGQGVSVTPLQQVRFYGALVNDGVECTPHFLIKKPQSDEEVTYETAEVIRNKQVIGDLTNMLEAVITEGTAQDISIDGYRVAGKTGTAEIASSAGGYKSGIYNVSFVGFLPHSDSQLVCFVGATDVPGGGNSTPMFQDIMTFAIDRYRIVPSEG